MRNLLSKLLRKKNQNLLNEKEDLVLLLKYQNFNIGKLWTEDSKYFFSYDKEFINTDLRPLTGFEDLEKVYSSSVLFPFFEVRIPDMKREDVIKKLQEKHLDKTASDLKKLLVLGNKTINDPYVLTLRTV